MRYPPTIHVTDAMIALIDQPLDPALISSREAARNSTVSYIKGDIVADQLNRIFGPLGWGVVAKIGTTEDWEEEKNVRRNNEYVAVNMHMVMVVSDVTLTIKKTTPDGTDTIFTQPGIGYGEVEVGKSRKDAYGMAVKGAATDGLKRCATLIGKALGMMMASNGSQEDIQYAHNSNANALSKARGMRRDQQGGQDGARGQGATREQGGSRDQVADRSRGDDRQDRGRTDTRQQERPRERAEAAPDRRDDRREAGPRHDETPREEPRAARQEANAAADGQGRDGSSQKAPAAKAGARRASTDFNLETLPVSQQEMTDFAATLVERVKELRQEGDRRSLVRQHTNTIRNLDSKIRTRLIERLAEAGVEDDTIRA